MNTYIAVLVVGVLAVLSLLAFGRNNNNELVQTPDGEVIVKDVTNIDLQTPKDPAVPIKGKTMNLSGKGLTKVSDSVFKQTDLEILDLSNNKLDGALQAEVRHLSNLVSLDLSDNNFTGVPAEVGQLSKLRYLDLSNNQLTGLPYELGNLQNLETLDLRGNDYAEQDLEIIRGNLPASTKIITE